MASEKTNKATFSDKSTSELTDMLQEFTSELMGLRVQKAVGQMTAPHRIKVARRNIARVKTLLHLVKLSEKN